MLSFDLPLLATFFASGLLFALGFVIWWRRRGQLLNALFSLTTWSVAFVILTPWFVRAESRASDQPSVLLWQLLFFVAIAFLPALCVHVTSEFSLHRFRGTSWLWYFAAAVLVVLFDAPDWVTSLGLSLSDANQIVHGASTLLVLLAIAAVFTVSLRLHPLLYDATVDLRIQRQAAYLTTVLFLALAILSLQLLDLPISAIVASAVGAFVFWMFTVRGCFRVGLFESDLTWSEVWFLGLFAVAFTVVVMTRDPRSWLIVSGVSGALLLAFGWIARHAHRERSERRRIEIEHQELIIFVQGMRASVNVLRNGDAGELSDKARQLLDAMAGSGWK